MGKILITGCAGFIGSNLAEKLLSQNHIVIGMDNFDDFYSTEEKRKNLSICLSDKNFTFIEGDVCKNSDLDKIPTNIDAVIHLASKAGVRPSINSPETYITNNILGTQSILEWMRKSNTKKMIFASSSSIYGNNKKTPFSESDVVDTPISPYAFTKKSCELLNYTYHHLYNLNIINLRFFTVYGPRQRPDLAIRKFIKLINANNPIPVFGNGNTGRDYTYIDDIVNGIIASLDHLQKENKTFETINLGNSSPVLLNDLISLLYKLLKKTPQINYLPMQDGDVDLTYADISKAKNLLNYSPQTTLESGLQKFIDWNEQV